MVWYWKTAMLTQQSWVQNPADKLVVFRIIGSENED